MLALGVVVVAAVLATGAWLDKQEWWFVAFLFLATAYVVAITLLAIVRLRQRPAAAQPDSNRPEPRSPEERLLFAKRDAVAVFQAKIRRMLRETAQFRVEVFKAIHEEVMEAITRTIKPGKLEGPIAAIRDAAEGEIDERSGAPERFHRLDRALTALASAMTEFDIMDDGIARAQQEVGQTSGLVADEIRKAEAAKNPELADSLVRAQCGLSQAKQELGVAAYKAKQK